MERQRRFSMALLLCAALILICGCRSQSEEPTPTTATNRPVDPPPSIAPARETPSPPRSQQKTPTHETVRLTLEKGQAKDYFGSQVAFCGDLLVVSCGGDDTVGRDAGAVCIFRADAEGQWRLTQTLHNPQKSYTRFGYTVAATRDVVVVGAQWEAPYAGAVYVYERSDADEWEQTTRLESAEDFEHQLFGSRLALSADLLIVGAEQQHTAAKNAGAAFIFRRRQRGDWERVAKLTSDNIAANDQFGAAVAISGKTAVVGSRHHDDNTGRAYVFQEDDAGVWRQVAELQSDQPVKWAQFGIAVAIDGQTVVVGEWRHQDRKRAEVGAVYVFQPDPSGNWRLQQKLLADDAAAHDRLGYSVAIHGDRILAGMIRFAEGPRLAGVYLFTRRDDGRFEQTAKFGASDGQPRASFGTMISLGERHVAVGDESQADFRGAAYLFPLP